MVNHSKFKKKNASVQIAGTSRQEAFLPASSPQHRRCGNGFRFLASSSCTGCRGYGDCL